MCPPDSTHTCVVPMKPFLIFVAFNPHCVFCPMLLGAFRSTGYVFQLAFGCEGCGCGDRSTLLPTQYLVGLQDWMKPMHKWLKRIQSWFKRIHSWFKRIHDQTQTVLELHYDGQTAEQGGRCSNSVGGPHGDGNISVKDPPNDQLPSTILDTEVGGIQSSC